MTQKAKNILITLGFAISAIFVVTCFIPLVTYIAFPIMLVCFVLWINHTTIGKKVYEKFLDSIRTDEEIEDFDYSTEE